MGNGTNNTLKVKKEAQASDALKSELMRMVTKIIGLRMRLPGPNVSPYSRSEYIDRLPLAGEQL